MSDCPKCLEADVFCAYDSQTICENHLDKHFGPSHLLMSQQVENKELILEFNKKVLKKQRKDLEKLENDSKNNFSKPFWVENNQKVYLNEAHQRDLNPDVIPVLIEGFIWLIDLKKKSSRIVKKSLGGRAGFTMNVYKNRLVLTGGSIFDRLLDNVEDLFDQGFKLNLANPRFFHSAVIHEDVLYVIGGLMKYESYWAIESLNLSENHPDHIKFSDISCKMLNPLSFFQNDSIFTFFARTSEGEQEVMKFNLSQNTREVKAADSVPKLNQLPLSKIVDEFNNFWTSSNLVFFDPSQVFVYLPSEQKIVKSQKFDKSFSLDAGFTDFIN